MVKIKSSMTLTNPNGQTTGGSITSELNCLVSLLHYYIMMISFKVLCIRILVGYDSGLPGVEPAYSTDPWSELWSEMAWFDSKVFWRKHWSISKVLVRCSDVVANLSFGFFLLYSVCAKRQSIYMCTMPMEQLFLKLKWMSSQEKFRYSGSISSMTVDKGTIKMSFWMASATQSANFILQFYLSAAWTRWLI